MEINCTTDGQNIVCNLPDYPVASDYSTTGVDPSGSVYIINHSYTYGDLAVCFFLLILLCMVITKWVHHSLQIPYIRIKRKHGL